MWYSHLLTHSKGITSFHKILQQTSGWSHFAKSTYDSILSPFMMFIWIHLLDMILKCTNASCSCVYQDDKKEIDNLEIKNSLSWSFIKLKIQMFCN